MRAGQVDAAVWIRAEPGAFELARVTAARAAPCAAAAAAGLWGGAAACAVYDVEFAGGYGFVPRAGGVDWYADAKLVEAAAKAGHTWSSSADDDRELLAGGALSPAMATAIRLRLALKTGAEKVREAEQRKGAKRK